MRRRNDGRVPTVAGTADRSSEAAPLLPELVRRSLRSLFVEQWPAPEPTGDLRLALRDACDRARHDGLRAEQFLLVLKAAWHDMPERRVLPHIDADAVLARVVTACIDEYYHSPPAGQQLGNGRALRSEARQVRADSQNAELH